MSEKKYEYTETQGEKIDLYGDQNKVKQQKIGPKIVPKRWGREVILCNNDMYCGKFLEIQPGKSMSNHYHEIKDETFYVLEGYGTVIIDNKQSANFTPGAMFRMEPGMKHKLVNPSEWILLKILEVSTHDDPEDSYRDDLGNCEHELETGDICGDCTEMWKTEKKDEC